MRDSFICFNWRLLIAWPIFILTQRQQFKPSRFGAKMAELYSLLSTYTGSTEIARGIALFANRMNCFPLNFFPAIITIFNNYWDNLTLGKVFICSYQKCSLHPQDSHTYIKKGCFFFRCDFQLFNCFSMDKKWRGHCEIIYERGLQLPYTPITVTCQRRLTISPSGTFCNVEDGLE